MKDLALYFLNKLNDFTLRDNVKISLENIIIFSKQFFVSLLAALLVLSIYHQSITQTKIVTIDIARLSKECLKTLTQRTLTEKESREAVQDYVSKLEMLLQKIALDNHWVILPKEAVIKGAPDFTDDIERLLKQSSE